MVNRWIVTILMFGAIPAGAWADRAPLGPRFEISFPGSVGSQAVTGRMLLMISRKEQPEVRLQVGWVDSPPVFGLDVSRLQPGEPAVIDARTPGYPVVSLEDIPAGDYYVQAMLNVYTEFHRADGHVIWAHMDQWEGQQFNQSPGNLYSKVQLVHLDSSHPHKIKIELTEIIPPVQVPADTEWVKHIKIQSKLLTRFWGHPMFIGAVVLLPRGYSSHSDIQYPVVYTQGHFSLDGPFGFGAEDVAESEIDRQRRQNVGYETNQEFRDSWKSEHFPRVVAVSFLHPTPYYDDSYAVNSANNGPYGDAILTELIPLIEEHFRIIREPYARVLAGGSTGGWESLALQLYHPKFFGGAWVLYPDPVDFRRYGLVDIYQDESAFVFNSPPGPAFLEQGWLRGERFMERADDGQPIASMRHVSQLEAVLGSKDRSAGPLATWEAVYGPVGSDGYPKPLWNDITGKIDHSVANYMRDQGYDLRNYAETHWATIGPDLVGKLHFYCGDMDNFYLNLSVYLMEDFLKHTQEPYYDGSFEYGRPMKGHGWRPFTNAEFVRRAAMQIEKNAPRDASRAWQND